MGSRVRHDAHASMIQALRKESGGQLNISKERTEIATPVLPSDRASPGHQLPSPPNSRFLRHSKVHEFLGSNESLVMYLASDPYLGRTMDGRVKLNLSHRVPTWLKRFFGAVRNPLS